jgi:lysophospholipase L1-like esterase
LASNKFWLSLPLIAAVMAGGCESATTPTPPGPAPVIACPAAASATPSFDGNPVAVTYGKPTVTGGEAPVAVSCVPASGANFPVGTTAVTCLARDAKQQTAACTFPVVVTKVPQLAATRFVAFGDSITEGFEQACRGTLTLSRLDYLRESQGLRPPPLDSPISYPNQLRTLLSMRYSAQTFTVINEGSGGEMIADGAMDLPRVLTNDMPQVLLLQEGANDVIQGTSPASIASSLRSMIKEGRNRGMPVFVGTILPQRPLGFEGSCRGWGAAAVAPANDQIRIVVASEAAVLVDLYQAFGGVASADLIGPDGLHPTAAGYQKIAETFFDVIKQRLER